MSSSGVRGSGLTSPGPPTTVIAHDDPAACEHCCVTEAPCGRVDGAAPTRRMSRAEATAGWLVTDTTATSSAPGTAVSAPVMVTMEPSCETVKAGPACSTAYSMPSQSSRSCHVVIWVRSKVAVSPGPTVSDAGCSSGCGSTGMTVIGTERYVQSSWPSRRTGTWHASTHGAPAPAS